MNGADVLAAAAACSAFLDGHVDGDWSAPVPDLDMTVAGVVAHAAEGCLWYAIDLAAGGRDLPTVEHRVKPDGSGADLVATVRAYAAVAASVVDAAPPGQRGFHPFGAADPPGFAAMACDELLVHTDDAGRGLGAAFSPPPELAERVLRRLFPEVPPDAADDPWTLLRWANGRIALPGRPRREGWRWQSAPLEHRGGGA